MQHVTRPSPEKAAHVLIAKMLCPPVPIATSLLYSAIMLHITQTKQTQTHKCQIHNTTHGLKRGDKLCGTREWHGICLLCFKHLTRRDYIHILAG